MIAITCLPSPAMNDAVRTFIGLQPIDVERAGRQHADYRAALARAGASVVVLEPPPGAPDAVFVEDTAIVLDELAILGSMGAPSRRVEVEHAERELRKHRREVRRVTPPATIEGGDVLRVGRTLYVGATGRTNAAGCEALRELSRPHGYEVRRVSVSGCLHLKTGCTALPDGTLLVNPRWVDLGDLGSAPLLAIADDEPDAANVVLVGERVILAAAYPRTAEVVRQRGFEVDLVDLSELAKAEGSATCLSVLVPAV